MDPNELQRVTGESHRFKLLFIIEQAKYEAVLNRRVVIKAQLSQI